MNGLLLDFGILKGQHLDHFCWLTTLTDLFFTLSVTDIANFVDANVLDSDKNVDGIIESLD